MPVFGNHDPNGGAKRLEAGNVRFLVPESFIGSDSLQSTSGGMIFDVAGIGYGFFPQESGEGRVDKHSASVFNEGAVKMFSNTILGRVIGRSGFENNSFTIKIVLEFA